MDIITFQIVEAKDSTLIEFIANWYAQEWHIPVIKTTAQLAHLSSNDLPFQIVMFLNGKPIATGGVYNHVGLIDIEPRFSIHKNWLALVFTKEEERGKGYGSILCREIEEQAQKRGCTEIHLFTHTAEKLYLRLGWHEIDRLNVKNREIVVMNKRFL